MATEGVQEDDTDYKALAAFWQMKYFELQNHTAQVISALTQSTQQFSKQLTNGAVK